MGLIYRIRQLVMRLQAKHAPLDESLIEQVLGAQGATLYRSLEAGDRAHSLCVWTALRSEAQAEAPLALQQAALLHDLGKARSGLTLWRRTLIVLLRATWPAGLLRLARLGQDDAWARPFNVHVHHAQLGADRCQRAGLDPAIVALVRLHDTPLAEVSDARQRALLARLQEADDRC